MVVVLPEPLGPRSPKIAPAGTFRFRLRTAVVPANLLTRFSQRRAVRIFTSIGGIRMLRPGRADPAEPVV